MAEFDWIDRYLRPLVTAPGAHDLRDDVAALSDPAGHVMIATMDTLVEGVHFLTTDPVDTVARKLCRVNVSDSLAKGAVSHEALVSIAWPLERGEGAFAEFAEALGDDLEAWGVSLLGGDLVRTPGPMTLTMTLTGRCGAGGPVRRSGGRVGDDVWVSGEIGAGVLGLEAARGEGDAALVAGYRVPNCPPLAMAKLVADYATGSIDVSDGLLSDVSHLARESGVGVSLNLERVLLVQPTRDIDSVLHQCTGGDDYQTLFSASPDHRGAISSDADAKGLVLTRIGSLSSGDGLVLLFDGRRVEPPAALGYVHDTGD